VKGAAEHPPCRRDQFGQDASGKVSVFVLTTTCPVLPNRRITARVV
jgi:hypothetical protein